MTGAGKGDRYRRVDGDKYRKNYDSIFKRKQSMNETGILPTKSSERKEYPITEGVLDYFPDAIAEVARVSFVGNEKHNPGQPLHWNREVSNDHADCVGRHLLERGTVDDDGLRHSACLVWRGLALLQLEMEALKGNNNG